MNKLSKIEPTHFENITLDESRDRILSYHQGYIRSAQQQFGYQFLAGIELHRVKDALAHGQFLKWREENLPSVPARTASHYMTFAQELISKSATVADLTRKPLELTNGEIPDRERKAILEAVYEFADGRSVTELYRDLGVIRPPQKQKYTPPKDLSAEEKAAAEEAAAEDAANDLYAAASLLADPHTRSLLTNATKKRIIDECVSLANLMRGDLSPKSKKKGSK